MQNQMGAAQKEPFVTPVIDTTFFEWCSNVYRKPEESPYRDLPKANLLHEMIERY